MKRKKRSLEITEEFKKKLLSKVFKGSYAECRNDDSKFLGYIGVIPVEVEFFYSLVYVKRMDKPRNTSTSNNIMADILRVIFGSDGLEVDKMYNMDFEGAEMNLDSDYRMICMKLFEKEKEVAA